MKNLVSKFITELGGKSNYSGSKNTMFLKHSSLTLAQMKGHIYNKFGKLTFKLA
jgi:hypothetical protein